MIEYWDQALAEEVGLRIQVAPEERKLLQQQLYRARTESGDAKYADLVIIVPENPSNELWIAKRDADEPNR